MKTPIRISIVCSLLAATLLFAGCQSTPSVSIGHTDQSVSASNGKVSGTVSNEADNVNIGTPAPAAP